MSIQHASLPPFRGRGRNSLSIHIPKPCHESWDAMTPAQQGRFCQSCAKTVVDFSMMTDSEVLNYFTKNTGNTCGRFSDDQLQRPLQPIKQEKRKAWWIAALMPLLMVYKKGYAQGEVSVKLRKAPSKVQHMAVTRKLLQRDTVRNTIISLSVSKELSKEIKPVDYDVIQKDERPIDKYALQETLLQGTAGGVYICAKPKPIDTIPTLIRRVFNTSFFKIFPNPAPRGSIANIDVKKQGSYSIQLFDNSGKLIQVTTFNTAKGSTQTAISIPQTLSAGMYYIRLVNEQNKKQYTDKIVVM